MNEIICSECGEGHFYPAHALHTPTDAEYVCDECGAEVNARDFVLDPGEALTLDAQGRVSYLAAGE
jgi:DNA-directed RNA polymerase subunit RPC12/RpoP